MKAIKEPIINIAKNILKLITEIDKFKGLRRAIGNLRPDRLQSLKRFAAIFSVGPSIWIEGAKITDQEVGTLLAGIDIRSFSTWHKQEVGDGYLVKKGKGREMLSLICEHPAES